MSLLLDKRKINIIPIKYFRRGFNYNILINILRDLE